ncbi:hypothetical protein [Pseudomonas sp. F3-2]|uniref:hypothetical protein n=1 Tax=Pseudomonas sp. F3-2 TaxID=3141539 RepID=UPI00315C5472
MKGSYNQDRFMGVKINCSESTPSRVNIIEPLYVMIYKSSKRLKRPLGFHVRVRFTAKMDMRSFGARLAGHYSRKYGYLPLRVSAREDDPQDGVHYHMAVIIDGKVSTKRGLARLLHQLQEKGFLNDYKVITPNDSCFGLALTYERDMDKFFDWLSYIGKNETKSEGVPAVSTCKAVRSDLKEWVANGKPMLTESTSPQSACSLVSSVALRTAINQDPLGEGGVGHWCGL